MAGLDGEAGRDVLAAAGVLFPDEQGRVMVVRTSYLSKHPIEVPGGGWDATDRSPRHTAVREIQEELGITPVLRELACLDWARDRHRPPIAAFLYWADPLTAQQRAAVRLEAAELDGLAYLTPGQLLSALPPLLSRRVGSCVRAPRAAAPLELADGLPAGHTALHLAPWPAPPYTGPAELAGLLPPGSGRAAPPPPMDRDTYLASRPRLRGKARTLFTDPEGRALLVRLKPWRDASPWVLPGGSIEADRELPREAARRETLEELGWHREPGRLLAVDWAADHPWDPPHLVLVFDGGTVTADQLAAIRLQEDELVEWRLFTPEEAARVLRPSAAARLTACLAVRAQPPGIGPAELLSGAPLTGTPTVGAADGA
ncbi:NUDIX hydrolase [Streptomyces sp. TLI_171]|uniref:NUDIX hydrolase n=1 Tax=Streptomyces sp. TLI_171 TaxID=1938859 RepID=UPI000C1747DC|nr:NUDIX hydrolase [Streptomyces sp. TLI_171]RKE17642.1 8-oxo-dGTP pyrophosphatase MutT (NUDIX family) [Streptomyces sp. TLI_171]